MATKLACEHSDLDLAVCGLPIKTRDDLDLYLLRVSEKLEADSMVISCTSIPTARVPLISAV